MRISDWSSDVCSSDLLADVGRGDLDHALVIDVDLGAGGGDDLADHLAAGADDVTDLRLVDLHRLDARGVRREFFARVIARLGHFAEDMRAAIMRLRQRDLHDLFGDAGAVDVHLKAGHAIAGARDFYVHVSAWIPVAKDGGEEPDN